MASTATSTNPSREDFAAMLDESFGSGNLQEGNVIKGTVVAIEKDVAVIDEEAHAESVELELVHPSIADRRRVHEQRLLRIVVRSLHV